MTEITKEYASALFMLALESKKEELIGGELGEIEKLLEENPDYVIILESPSILLSERIALIDEAFGGFEEYVVSFVKLLCENGRIALIKDIILEYQALLRHYQNRASCRVYYASELSAEQKKSLMEKLEKISGKKVDAVYIEDKSLIGGFKVYMDDMMLDASISGKLLKVKGVIGE